MSTRRSLLTACAPRPVDDRVHALHMLEALAGGRSEVTADLDGTGLDGSPSLLDARSHALVRVGALIASGACAVTCAWAGQRARQAGATNAEMAAVLVAIGSTLGSSRLVEAAPRLAAAIGYDLDAAFEAPPAPASV